MLSECQPIPDFIGVHMGDLLEHSIAVVDLYHECAAKHKALADVLR